VTIAHVQNGRVLVDEPTDLPDRCHRSSFCCSTPPPTWTWMSTPPSKRPSVAASTRLAELLSSLKNQAFARLADSRPGLAVPAALTSKGLALSYTISAREDRFLHVLAISLPGRITTHGAAHRIAKYLLVCLGITNDQALLVATRSTVHHLRFVVDADGQRRLASVPAAVPPHDPTQLALLDAVSNDFPCQAIDGTP
jgi:hypothetical protein